jgi:HTH-type transcriptional regulator/antitoxin HigA
METTMNRPMLDFSTPHVLRSVEEYDLAAAEILALLDRDPEFGSADYDRLELLTVLIQAYDAEHVRFGEDADTTPQEIVDFVLEQHGKARTDLTRLFGGRSRVSEFFSGKRALSMNQVIALREAFSIPVELLIPKQRSNPLSTEIRKTPSAKTKRNVRKAGTRKPRSVGGSSSRVARDELKATVRRVSEPHALSKPGGKAARKK